MQEPNEEQNLLSKAAQGDAAAQRTLYQRDKTLVYRIAYRVTGHQTEAEEVTVRTFSNAFSGLLEGAIVSDFSAWIGCIAFREAINAIRKRPPPTYSLDELNFYRSDPICQVQHRKTEEDAKNYQMAEIRAAMVRILPDEYLAVIILVLEGQNEKQIAATLGIKIGTVRSRKFRAIELLRTELCRKEDVGP